MHEGKGNERISIHEMFRINYFTYLTDIYYYRTGHLLTSICGGFDGPAWPLMRDDRPVTKLTLPTSDFTKVNVEKRSGWESVVATFHLPLATCHLPLAKKSNSPLRSLGGWCAKQQLGSLRQTYSGCLNQLRDFLVW